MNACFTFIENNKFNFMVVDCFEIFLKYFFDVNKNN